MNRRRLLLAASLLLLALAVRTWLLSGPDRPTVSAAWVSVGQSQLRLDRVSTWTLEQYRNYQRPPQWLLDLADRFRWLAHLKPPLNGIEAPPYQHETAIVEVSLQGDPLPQPQDLAFFLEVEGETLEANGHSWANEPGKPLRMQTEFYMPEGARPSAVIVTLNGQPHRFQITYR